jgi:hypothetical protein
MQWQHRKQQHPIESVGNNSAAIGISFWHSHFPKAGWQCIQIIQSMPILAINAEHVKTSRIVFMDGYKVMLGSAAGDGIEGGKRFAILLMWAHAIVAGGSWW